LLNVVMLSVVAPLGEPASVKQAYTSKM
jgi:hypothetical protein